MIIKNFVVHTSIGRIIDSKPQTLPFLSKGNIKEFNTIGYTKKNSKGVKTSYEEYLNSLGKGQFKVLQTKYDNGDFSETFVITQVI